MKALITIGCKTDHGGIIVIGNDSFLVDSKAVHLDGMTHYCPKCRVQSKAIASQKGFMIVDGKSIVAAGDTSTCGSKYLKISDLAVMTNGSGTGSSLLNSSFVSAVETLLFSDKFVLIDQDTGEFLENIPYKIHREDGSIEEGITNKNGLIGDIKNKEKPESIKVELINNFDLEEAINEYNKQKSNKN